MNKESKSEKGGVIIGTNAESNKTFFKGMKGAEGCVDWEGKGGG